MAKVARQQTAEKEAGRSLELIANLARLFWDDVADRISQLVKSLIEEFLEARRTEILGAGSYERTPGRNGHRGGSYGRRLKTKWGEVLVRVPRVAGGSYELEIIDRWGRRQAHLDEAIGKLFLAGVSTRRLEKVAEELFGIGLSRSAVSETTKALDAEVAAFRAKKAVATLKRDLHQCLAYLDFPEEDHKAIRATNALERSFREVRRRTRPMGVYVNAASADRIMFGVTEEMNDRWRGAPQLAKSAS